MSDRITYPDDFARFAARLNGIEAAIRNLSVPTDGQFTRTVTKILALFDSLEEQVSAAIDRTSYVRATIDAKDAATLQAANDFAEPKIGTLPPAKGGTGTTNAYANAFTQGPWRATWSLSDGTLGTSQSSRRVKSGITDADRFIPISALRAVPWVVYRYSEDLNLNSDSATPRLGMIAEDLDQAGLGWFVEYDDETLEPVGISYPMLSLAALRLAQDGESRIDQLEQRVATLEKGPSA